jgi:hypothetical protein
MDENPYQASQAVQPQAPAPPQNADNRLPLWVAAAILASLAAFTLWDVWKGELSAGGAVFIIGVPTIGWLVARWFRWV